MVTHMGIQLPGIQISSLISATLRIAYIFMKYHIHLFFHSSDKLSLDKSCFNAKQKAEVS